MIIVVSWYSDGSSPPYVIDIPDSKDKMHELVRVMHELSDSGKCFRVFQVDDTGKPLVELGLHQSAKESND